MNLRIGLYDFFAYTVPGSLYVFVAYYLLVLLGWLKPDAIRLSDLTFAQVVAIAVIAYLAGMLLSPVANRWLWLFRRRESVIAGQFERFKRDHPYLQVQVDGPVWPIMFAQVRQHNLELATEIDRHNVTSIMLRNVSLALLTLSVVEAVRAVWAGFHVGHLALAIIAVLGSLLALRQSIVFARWFFTAIYEASAALALQPHDILVLLKPTHAHPGSPPTSGSGLSDPATTVPPT
jgi:hypothetical protein